MSTTRLDALCQMVTDAHKRIQLALNVNPLVGVTKKMRGLGIPADMVTIDCLKSNKRIILLLHDQQPDIISYQFTYLDKDPVNDFRQVDSAACTANDIYALIENYFYRS